MTDERPLPDPRSGPQKDAALVQRMFDRVAPRYDLANSIFSLGLDRGWRRAAVAAVDPRPGEVVLDVAAGTGALSHELARAGRRRSGWPPTRVVALDFSWSMVATGARRQAASPSPDSDVEWINGDGTALPLPDASVDAVTVAFGLRNLPDPAAGLSEMRRVLRPGGRLVLLEFSQPTSAWVRRVYLDGVLAAMPLAARLVTSDPRAYAYLAESIRQWPDAPALARTIAAAGFSSVQLRRLTGGIVALHRARRPERGDLSAGQAHDGRRGTGEHDRG